MNAPHPRRFHRLKTLVGRLRSTWRRDPEAHPARHALYRLEALEPRLLLSADPVLSLGASGVLTAELTAGADRIEVDRVATAADGAAAVWADYDPLPVLTDPELAHELLFGPVYYRLLLSGAPLDHALAERVTDAAIAALR